MFSWYVLYFLVHASVLRHIFSQNFTLSSVAVLIAVAIFFFKNLIIVYYIRVLLDFFYETVFVELLIGIITGLPFGSAVKLFQFVTQQKLSRKKNPVKLVGNILFFTIV